ncbi:MAG: Gx transporter family protein [Oscillospiraceae bacterium]|nr:Gx transporter family protein [Oscillospiraceae bacterium]
MKTNAKHIAFLGIFLAFSVAAGYFERMLPSIVPALPGIKLGLPNLAVVVLIYIKDNKTAFLLNMLRVALSGILFSGALGAFYGLVGAIFSFFAMVALKSTKKFGTVGVSAAGGVFHNLGQICVGAALIGSLQLFYYFPVLIIFGALAGAVTGYLAGLLIKRLEKIDFGGKL